MDAKIIGYCMDAKINGIWDMDLRELLTHNDLYGCENKWNMGYIGLERMVKISVEYTQSIKISGYSL